MSFGTVNVTQELVGVSCIECGMQFGVSKDFQTHRQADHKTFYCPNGHGQLYPTVTEADKLREQLSEAHARIARETAAKGTAERTAKRLAREMKRKDARIASGVCPCCDRYFDNLHKHMTTQHPDQDGAKHADPHGKKPDKLAAKAK